MLPTRQSPCTGRLPGRLLLDPYRRRPGGPHLSGPQWEPDERLDCPLTSPGRGGEPTTPVVSTSPGAALHSASLWVGKRQRAVSEAGQSVLVREMTRSFAKTRHRELWSSLTRLYSAASPRGSRNSDRCRTGQGRFVRMDVPGFGAGAEWLAVDRAMRRLVLCKLRDTNRAAAKVMLLVIVCRDQAL